MVAARAPTRALTTAQNSFGVLGLPPRCEVRWRSDMGQKAGHGDELLGLVISNSPSTSRSLDWEGPLAGGGTAVSAGDDRRGASAGCSGLLS